MNQQTLVLPLSRPAVRSQSGAALIIGLVLLIALTIIGVGTLSTTSLEHRMAGNMGDLNLAFNASETVSRALTQIITPLATPPAEQADCVGKKTTDATLCIIKRDNTEWWKGKDHTWWKTNTTQLKGDVELDAVSTQPHALVENLMFDSDDINRGHDYITKGTQYYRITSRGTGVSDKSQSIIQQTIVKRFN